MLNRDATAPLTDATATVLGPQGHDMIQQLFSIGRNTFIESIRQPIFAVLTAVSILSLIFSLATAGYTMGDDNKMMLDISLSIILIAGLLLAAFTATGVLSQEIENRTVLTVVSKPVARPVFVLGKFLGIVAALAVAYWVLAATLLLTLRHTVLDVAGKPFDMPVLVFGLGAALIAVAVATFGNYFYHWVFTSSLMISLFVGATAAWALVLLVSKDWRLQSPAVDFDKQIMIGLLLLFQSLLILAAVALAVSTRLGQVMTLVLCVAVAAAGTISDYVLGRFAGESKIYDTLYRLVPNLQMFWPADALTGELAYSGRYVGLASGYCVFLVMAFLSLAVNLFQTREVG